VNIPQKVAQYPSVRIRAEGQLFALQDGEWAVIPFYRSPEFAPLEDLAFLDRLEQIRMQRATWVEAVEARTVAYARTD
jgi:hypothetical protein